MIDTLPNYVFSIFAFIGFVLCAIPFAWHLEAWNVGTCLYMMWTSISCLILFINSIIWNGNAFNWAPVYCDLSTKFLAGASVGIPVASLCINRRLYHIASIRCITSGPADKIRDVIIDLSFGLGIPVIFMALHFLCHGHRFDVYEDIGCVPHFYAVVPNAVFVQGIPLAIGCISAVYVVLSIRALWRTKSQLNEFLGSGGHRNLNSSRYYRLMALAGIEILCTIPLCLENLIRYGNAILPYKGWVYVHMGWQRVDQYPAIIWKNNPLLAVAYERFRWLYVACALVFFIFFGFADEAMKNYRSAARTISKTIGLSTAGETTFNVAGSKSKGFNVSNGTLPSFVRQGRKRNSLDSISDYTSSQNGDKEKHGNVFNPDFSYGALTLNDVGGALETSSAATPVDVKAPTFPPTAVTRTSSDIEETSRAASPTSATHDGMKIHTPDMV